MVKKCRKFTRYGISKKQIKKNFFNLIIAHVEKEGRLCTLYSMFQIQKDSEHTIYLPAMFP